MSQPCSRAPDVFASFQTNGCPGTESPGRLQPPITNLGCKHASIRWRQLFGTGGFLPLFAPPPTVLTFLTTLVCARNLPGSVILAAGDELVLRFDVSQLQAPPPGWVRSVFLESHGWDKDADRNTWEAQQMEPLPFRNMPDYLEATGEDFPETEEHQKYREVWLTRTVAGQEESE